MEGHRTPRRWRGVRHASRFAKRPGVRQPSGAFNDTLAQHRGWVVTGCQAGLVSASPGEGRPGIAHRFIGGNGLEAAPESRQGRKKGQGRKMILPSLAGLVPQPTENPALKRWANKAALTTHTDDRAGIVDC